MRQLSPFGIRVRPPKETLLFLLGLVSTWQILEFAGFSLSTLLTLLTLGYLILTRGMDFRKDPLLLLLIPAGGFLPSAALLLVGFALAPVYPCLMHEATRRGFNDATAAALTGLQGAASMVGIMIVPPLIGYAGDLISMETLPVSATVLAAIMFAALLKTGYWPTIKTR